MNSDTVGGATWQMGEFYPAINSQLAPPQNGIQYRSLDKLIYKQGGEPKDTQMQKITVMSHLLTGTKFSDFATFVFSVGRVQGVVTSVFIL